jgi:hypothetical protein
MGGHMMPLMLRERGSGESGGPGQEDQKALHAAPPSFIGRTFTIRIMPACMW